MFYPDWDPDPDSAEPDSSASRAFAEEHHLGQADHQTEVVPVKDFVRSYPSGLFGRITGRESYRRLTNCVTGAASYSAGRQFVYDVTRSAIPGSELLGKMMALANRAVQRSLRDSSQGALRVVFKPLYVAHHDNTADTNPNHLIMEMATHASNLQAACGYLAYGFQLAEGFLAASGLASALQPILDPVAINAAYYLQKKAEGAMTFACVCPTDAWIHPPVSLVETSPAFRGLARCAPEADQPSVLTSVFLLGVAGARRHRLYASGAIAAKLAQCSEFIGFASELPAYMSALTLPPMVTGELEISQAAIAHHIAAQLAVG